VPDDRVLVVEAPGRVGFRNEPLEDGAPEGTFDVKTVYSGLSAGTELSFVKGTHPNLNSGWDLELGLFREDGQRGAYPVTRWGYMQVGRIVESRSPALEPGTLVAMTYGHRCASAVRLQPSLVDEGATRTISTITPTVPASLRAGRTTLTVVSPFAANRSRTGQSSAVEVLVTNQRRTPGSISGMEPSVRRAGRIAASSSGRSVSPSVSRQNRSKQSA
jgi:hypothetical protein